MRRTLPCIACAAVAAAALLLASGIVAGAPESAPAVRTFRVSYKAKVPPPAEGSRRLEVWLPLPLADGVQKVSDVKVDSPVPHTIQTEPEYGNRMVHVVVENPKEPLAIGWSAVVTRTEDRGQSGGQTLPRFLQADNLLPLGGKAAELAAQLKVKDASRSTQERGRTIYDHVLATMAYDKETPGWSQGDFDR